MQKTDSRNYTVKVYSIKVNADSDAPKEFVDEDGYTAWGTSYPTEEAAVDYFKDYLNDLRKNSREYKTYTARPIKVICVTSKVRETSTQSFVNL